MEAIKSINARWRLWPLSLFQMRFYPFNWVAFIFITRSSRALFPDYCAQVFSWIDLLNVVGLIAVEAALRRWPEAFLIDITSSKAWSLKAAWGSVIYSLFIILLLPAPSKTFAGLGILIVIAIGLGVLQWVVFSVFENWEKRKNGRSGANAFFIITFSAMVLALSCSLWHWNFL